MKRTIMLMAVLAAGALFAPRASADSFSIAFGFSSSDWHNYGSRSIYASYCDPVYVTPVYHVYDSYCAPACGIVHAHYYAPCYPVYYSYYPSYRSTVVYDSYYAWPSYTPFYSFGGYFSYRSGNYWRYRNWDRPNYRGGHWGGYHYRDRWDRWDRNDHWGRWDRDRWDRDRRGWDRDRDRGGNWNRDNDRGGNWNRDNDRGGNWNRDNDRGGNWNRNNSDGRGGSGFRQDGQRGREILGDSRSPFGNRGGESIRGNDGGRPNIGDRNARFTEFDSRRGSFDRGVERMQTRQLPSREAISKGVTENSDGRQSFGREARGVGIDSSRFQRGPAASIDTRGGFENRARSFGNNNGGLRQMPQARGGDVGRGAIGRSESVIGRSQAPVGGGRSFGGGGSISRGSGGIDGGNRGAGIAGGSRGGGLSRGGGGGGRR